MNTHYSRLNRIAGQPRRLEAAQFAYHQGDDVEAVYLVRWGTVRLARLSLDGHETTLGHFGEGVCFGEAEVLLGLESRECFAQATSDVVIAPILLRSLGPEEIAELNRMAVNRLYRAQLCVAEMIGQHPSKRVASLLRYLSSHGSTIRLSHDEIGMTTDCPKEIVSQALRQLAKVGAVSVERGAIKVLDRRLLEA